VNPFCSYPHPSPKAFRNTFDQLFSLSTIDILNQIVLRYERINCALRLSIPDLYLLMPG
jgi:hypothetical protein